MPTTPKLAIPYPAAPDAADGPNAFKGLAERLDDIVAVNAGRGTSGAAPSAPSVPDGAMYRVNPGTGVQGYIIRSNGATWETIAVDPPPVVTSLPTAGLWNGCEVKLRVATNPDIYWLLRYVSANPTNQKWVPVGSQTPLFRKASTSLTLTGSSQNIPGTSMTLPAVGLYDMTIVCPVERTNAGSITLEFTNGSQLTVRTETFTAADARPVVMLDRAASASVGAAYNLAASCSPSGGYSGVATLTVTPVAIGA